MKKLILLTCIFLLSNLNLSFASENESPFLETAFSKIAIDETTYPHKEVEIMIKVITNSNIDAGQAKENVLHALSYHKRLCDAFKRNGWKICHPLDEKKQVGEIELTFEPRMNIKLKENLVIRTFIYVCGSERFRNMIKYRGGNIDKYFNKIVNKTKNCIKKTHSLAIGG